MNNRTIKVAWYKSQKNITISEKNIIDVLAPEKINKAINLESLINYHLDHPVGTPPFNEMCAGKINICVIICDLSRPMQTNLVLPVVLDRIKKVNPSANVKILIAQGTHRKLTKEEKIQLCGADVLEHYQVLDHEFDNPEQLKYVETSHIDFPIMVNKLLYESDFRIAIGAVKPHPIFGWSGGAKIIIPGVAGSEAIGLSHWNSCPYKGIEIMGLTENPVRHEVEEAVRREGLLEFILNAVLTENSEVADIRCGDFVTAHRECVNIAKKYYLKNVPEAADAVIVGAGKWGADLWVGSMSIYATEFFLKRGGTIIALEACPEGVSPMHPEILQYGYRPYQEVKKLVAEGKIDDLTLSAHLVHVGRVLEARQADCVILSDGISAEDAKKLGFGYLQSVEEIMPYIYKKHGKNARVLIIPGFSSTGIISENPAV